MTHANMISLKNDLTLVWFYFDMKNTVVWLHIVGVYKKYKIVRNRQSKWNHCEVKILLHYQTFQIFIFHFTSLYFILYLHILSYIFILHLEFLTSSYNTVHLYILYLNVMSYWIYLMFLYLFIISGVWWPNR